MTEFSALAGKNWRKRGYGSWYHQKSRQIYPAGTIYSNIGILMFHAINYLSVSTCYAQGKREVLRRAGKEGLASITWA